MSALSRLLPLSKNFRLVGGGVIGKGIAFAFMGENFLQVRLWSLSLMDLSLKVWVTGTFRSSSVQVRTSPVNSQKGMSVGVQVTKEVLVYSKMVSFSQTLLSSS